MAGTRSNGIANHRDWFRAHVLHLGAESQFTGTRTRKNRNSTPAMNSNAFHFAATLPVAGRGSGRCPGAAGSWLGALNMGSDWLMCRAQLHPRVSDPE